MKPRLAGRVLAQAAACLASLALCAPLWAQVTVPANAQLRVDGGRIDFGGSSFAGQGMLRLGAGRLDNLDDFRVLAGGTADLGSGVLRLAGDWENRGTVIAGTSTVEFIDSLADSHVIGTTDFANLRLATMVGKRLRLESGQTQRVSGNLVLTGSGAPLRIESTAPPAVAFLDLLPGGTQNIANVAVADVYGTGQLLAPGQVNQGGNGNVNGWFGSAATAPQLEVIPSASTWSLLLLAMMIGLSLVLRRDLRARFLSGDIA